MILIPKPFRLTRSTGCSHPYAARAKLPRVSPVVTTTQACPKDTLERVRSEGTLLVSAEVLIAVGLDLVAICLRFTRSEKRCSGKMLYRLPGKTERRNRVIRAPRLDESVSTLNVEAYRNRNHCGHESSLSLSTTKNSSREDRPRTAFAI